MAYIQYSEVKMACGVGSVAVQVVRDVFESGGPLDEESLVEVVYDRLWEVFGQSSVERDTDRTRVRDAVKTALWLESLAQAGG